MTYALGIRENLRPFLEQLVQVFFVGLTIGMQRTVIPALAETEFGVVQGSMTAIFAFIISFGIVKGVMNFVSGRLSERVGRRRVLIWGWLMALPIPFMILWAPSWGWIVAANVALGVNQGFCWSMTVTAKMDIVKGSERGLATGFNEFAGYGGVALAGLLTGYLASSFDPRMSLFVFGLVVIILALAAAVLAFTETLPFARAEAARHKAGDTAGQRSAYVDGPENPTAGQIFALVTWRNRTFMALAQAGSVEKFVDALMWALVPVFMIAKGASLIEIGWVTGIYGFVWGGSQLWTGPLSDAFGRKWPTVAGFFLCAAGVMAFPFLGGVTGWAVAAAVTGVGMALLYPTLIAAMGDIAHPSWRGSALGVYRFWRDLGYAIGALAMGLIADASGMLEAGFWLTAGAMALSGLWLILAMEETHPHFNPASNLEKKMPDTLTRRIGFFAVLLAVASFALLAVSVWGFRSAGWPWPRAYDIAGWGAWAAGAGVVVALIGLIFRLIRRRGGVSTVLLGLILSLPVAVLGAAFEIAARTTPPINDITTDIEDPPVFWFTATPSDYPTPNAAPQRAAYPQVRPLELPLSVDDAFTAALALVEARGWEVLSADPAEGQIEVIARSRFYGFEDEVAVRVTETDSGTRIDMRSRSRIGRIDRGANARRIAAFLADLEARILE